MTPIVALLLAVLCVLANAFFVAAEFAFAKVRPTALEAAARSGDKRAVRAFKMTQELDAYLTATQLGITLASLALGALGEPALARVIAAPLRAFSVPESATSPIAIALAFAVISIMHIVVGELVPKSLALAAPERVSTLTATALNVTYWSMYPALVVLNAMSRRVLKSLKLPTPEHPEGSLSLEELRLLIRAAQHDGEIEGARRAILERVLRSADRPVRSVMVPRVDMHALSLEEDEETWMTKVRQHGFSRFPISETGEADKIVGYLYAKDLILAPALPRGGLRALRRDILITPESRTVIDVLEDMRRGRIPIALVVDEFGGTSGLVTIEDLVEEIVGEIQDEHDTESPRVRELDDRIIVDGSVQISELPLEDSSRADVRNEETVGGYILSSLGRLARPGDRVRLGAYELLVQDVRRRRVERVEIKKSLSASLPPQGMTKKD